MRLRPVLLGRVAVALPLLVICAGSAAAQDLIKKSYLSAALAHEALTTAVETCAKQGQRQDDRPAFETTNEAGAQGERGHIRRGAPCASPPAAQSAQAIGGREARAEARARRVE